MYTRENMIKFAKENFEDIFNSLGKAEQGSLLGNITEVAVVKKRIAVGTDVSGSDMVENGLEKEIKSCWSLNGGVARFGNISSKKDKCHSFVFIDGVNNKEYEVPHDIVFSKMKITKAAGGEIRANKFNMPIFSKYEVNHLTC